MGIGVWELDHEAAALTSAAEQWRGLGAALEAAADDVNGHARQVVAAGWEGRTADSYDAHRSTFVSQLDEGAELAVRIARRLRQAAGSIEAAQGQLDASWAGVSSIPHGGAGPGGRVVFRTTDDDERERVRAADRAAAQIRADLDTTLAGDTADLTAATRAWQRLSAAWLPVADGSRDGFDVPGESSGTGVITTGSTTVVNGGAGEDDISVRIDPATGEQIVTINGVEHRVPAGQHVVIRGGGGDDTITVPQGTAVGFTIIGSEGADRLQGGDGADTLLGLDGEDEIDAGGGADGVSGGADRDYVDGQDGDDTLSGGLGDDTVYGLGGDDTVAGGEGQDYLEGGDGDDDLHGGAGDDVLSGGVGDDRLRGDGGDDVAYAGRGSDTTDGGSGADTAHAEDGDATTGVEDDVTVEIPDDTTFIRVEGSPEFRARVLADLEMMRSSPAGQEMLANLQRLHEESDNPWPWDATKELTIREWPDRDNYNSDATGHDDAHDNVIRYHTRIDTIDGAPPIAVLHHEMAHVYDFMNGSFDSTPYTGDDPRDHGSAQGERTAVGLPVDHDHDPSTPEVLDPDHPYALTENGLREEMGLPRREEY